MKLSFKRGFILGLLLVSMAALVCFSVIGIGRGTDGNADGAVLYAAGRAWLQGLNPYNHDELVRSVAGQGISLDGILFFYLPQSSALCITLALLPFPIAKGLWLVINLLAIAALITMTALTINRLTKDEAGRLGSWILAAVIIGNPFTSHVVWMGQTSLVATAATLGAWFFRQQNRWLLSGICLGFATFKPQLCFLLFIWFMLERNWRIVATALVAIGVFCLYPVLTQGPLNVLLDWYGGIQTYSTLAVNAPGFYNKVGLQSLLEAMGFAAPRFTVLGVALTVLLWLFRKHINPENILSILIGLTFTFVGFTHDYDYVLLVPVFTTLWVSCYSRPKAWLLILSLVFLLFLPHRIVALSGVSILSHWRTVVVAVFLLALVFLSGRRWTKWDDSLGEDRTVKSLQA